MDFAYSPRCQDVLARLRAFVKAEVEPREAVPLAAFARDDLIGGAAGKFLRALEQHVLHPMADAGDAGALAA